MSNPPRQSDQTLKDLAIEQTRAGDIETAKVTASQITNHECQRQACMTILYQQFYELNDLRGVKETVLSLSDSRLWMGSWVHDLVLRTARSGDFDGAKTFIDRLGEPSPRGHLLSLVVSAQAQQGDYQGAESTLATISSDNHWHDIALLYLAKAMAERGDAGQADVVAKRIVDSELKASALNLCTPPAVEP